jgi:threonine dehydratase
MSKAPMKMSDVLVAHRRIAPYIQKTPLLKSDWLSDCIFRDVYMKLENMQVTGSFKYRGALNALLWGKDNHISKVFTASAGNHGLGLAQAAAELHSDVTVCIPITASALKKQKLKSYSLSVIEHGQDYDTTESFARRLALEKKGTYISPYNNAEVIAGQGTIALELLEALPSLSMIVVAVGGGGLISGIATVAKAINPDIRVIGVVAANSPAMIASINAGRLVQTHCEPTLADGIWGNIEEGSITFPMAKENVDDWIAVEEEDIRGTIFDFLDNEGMLIEGAAAAAVAAISKKMIHPRPNEKIAVVVCGGNIARADWREIVHQHLIGKTRLI